MFYAAFVSSPDGGRKTLSSRFIGNWFRYLLKAALVASRDLRDVSKEHSEGTPASGQRVRSLNEEPRPVSNGMLVIFFAALAAALVLGYLLLNRLADISREEDCMLSRSRKCAATELPLNR